jgi:branched-chain amino acid transport system substrate-binding protein
MRWRSSLLLLSLAIGCGSDDDGTSEPLEIGVLVSLSGDLAQFGEDELNGMLLAADEINQGGGVLGRPLKLRAHDDGTTPNGVTVGFTTFLNDRLPVVVGPMFSGGVVAIEEPIRTGRTLIIAPSASSPALTELDDENFFFRSCASDAIKGTVLGQLVAEEDRSAICLVYRDDSFGNGLADHLAEYLGSNAPEVVVVESRYDPEAANLSDVMDPCDPVLGAESPGVVFITFEGDGRVIIDDAIARGWNATDHRVFMTDSISQTFIEALADPSAVEGAIGTAPSGPDPSTPAGARLRAFQTDFAERYDHPPSVYSENAYDAIYAAVSAIEIAGETEDHIAIRDALGAFATGQQVAAGDWQRMVEAIAADGAFDYQGASGDVGFDLTTGDLLPPFYFSVWKIQGGAIVPDRIVTIESL